MGYSCDASGPATWAVGTGRWCCPWELLAHPSRRLTVQGPQAPPSHSERGITCLWRRTTQACHCVPVEAEPLTWGPQVTAVQSARSQGDPVHVPSRSEGGRSALETECENVQRSQRVCRGLGDRMAQVELKALVGPTLQVL